MLYERNKVKIKKVFGDNGELLAKTKLKHGNLDGLQKRFYSNGKIKTETEYLKGIKNGKAKIYWENGNRDYR